MEPLTYRNRVMHATLEVARDNYQSVRALTSEAQLVSRLLEVVRPPRDPVSGRSTRDFDHV